MHIVIALSWFHRKVGPIVFYYYPEGELEEEEKIRIADQIDQAFEEGFFSHSFDELISMNYYFEIFSKWARGQKEMLMISAIFDTNVSSDVEHEVLGESIDFANRIKNHKDIYKAFYNEDNPQYSSDSAEIQKYSELVKVWVNELYWAVVEITREKTEEEIIAELMSQEAVYDLVSFLNHGPVSLEDLQFWFDLKFPDLNLQKTLEKLEKERIIFINDIGVENYVLLVKELMVERIPPECIITLFEEKPEIKELTELFSNKVMNFFSEYKPTPEDSRILFDLVADSKLYNLLSQLRVGPIPKEKFTEMIAEELKQEVIDRLDILKKHDIIDEFNYKQEKLLILKTDIRFKTAFPDYLKRIIPKKTQEQIAQKYQPTRSDDIDLESISLLADDGESGEIGDYNTEDLANIFGEPGDTINHLKELSESILEKKMKKDNSKTKKK
ncbi:MAG: hypothetical protein GF364_16915 [Candidatus Lokiarchaeota archaeon]|nr:hypothetical protein [Candidatus Lokiarchaeota archaeon]